jgi:hypothetical protein
MSLSFVRNVFAVGVTMTMLAAHAQAATIRVTCEKRSDRSVVSVDGNNLARGSYTAQVVSGKHAAREFGGVARCVPSMPPGAIPLVGADLLLM